MLKYVGNGDFIPGIPARDLSDDEVNRFGGKRKLVATGLYAEVKSARLGTENKMLTPESEDKEGE
jgi:hypothetical protein